MCSELTAKIFFDVASFSWKTKFVEGLKITILCFSSFFFVWFWSFEHMVLEFSIFPF